MEEVGGNGNGSWPLLQVIGTMVTKKGERITQKNAQEKQIPVAIGLESKRG